jgi:Na+/proline symporter
MLSSQAIDSNMLLGNVDLSYKYSFYDGAIFPVGLGLSLILNSIIFARRINSMNNILTLPDVLAVRYGKGVEVLVSLITITSFMMLLAGNLVGMGFVTSYVWGTSQTLGIWVSAYIVWAYTVGGGLFSIAYADVVQGTLGWYVLMKCLAFAGIEFLAHLYQTTTFLRSGCLVCAYWLIANDGTASPPSIGFPGFIYPNQDNCDLHNGIPCTYDPSHCCYNETKW